MRHREPAICLRTVDYSETSQVVHFLTRGAGVVHLLAKGTKRRKSKSGGPIDLTSEGELVFIIKSGGPLGILVEFTETSPHTGLRADEGRLYGAMYMLELISAMLPADDPHPDVFDLLHNGLERLDQPDASVSAVIAYFQWRLLRHVGLSVRISRCVSCENALTGAEAKRAHQAHFSSRLGGLICRDCEGAIEEKVHVDGPTLAGLAALAAAESGRRVLLPERQARDVNRLLAYHIQEQIGKPLHTARYIARQLPARPKN